MEVCRKHFPELIPDNDDIWIKHLSGALEAVDELSSMEVTKVTDGIFFRIVASIPKYTIPLLEEVLKFSNNYKLKLELSKSIKSSGSLCFLIKDDK